MGGFVLAAKRGIGRGGRHRGRELPNKKNRGGTQSDLLREPAPKGGKRNRFRGYSRIAKEKDLG